MNSRDRLSTCPLKTEIESELEEVLKNHQGLRILKDKRRKEEIENKLNDQQPLADILQDILKKSPTLSRLFVQGLKIQNPFNTTFSAKEEGYEGKEFPTYFTLLKKFNKETPKLAHLNSRFRVEFKTDVTNDYFDRSKDPGSFRLLINGKESEDDLAVNLWNGYAYLNVFVVNSKVGDLVHICCEVSDISRIEPLREEFYVKIIDPITKSVSANGKRKPPSSDKPGNEANRPDGFALPKIIEVSKDGRTGSYWEQQDFNESSALKIKGSEEDGFDFFVNIDNIYLLSELKFAKNTETQTIQAKYKFGIVLIGIALLNENEQKVDELVEEYNIFDNISKITKAISPIVIPMIDTLGGLELSDLVAISEEAS